jgi:deazaflavin-dependent oxidoreductase (nitroreductase family)
VKPGETEFLYLTTIGRRSGRQRQIEIWFTEHDGRYYAIAEHGWEAHWVRNILAEPRVTVRIADQEFAARARVIDAEPELQQSVEELSEEKYGWGDGLVVELRPARPGGA